MFGPIISALEAIWEWFGDAVSVVWGGVKSFFTSAWAIVAAFFAMIGQIWDWIIEAINKLVALLSSIAFPNLNIDLSALGTAFNVCNTFFPLAELFAVVASLFALKCIMAVYRFIKSLIPTWITGA